LTWLQNRELEERIRLTGAEYERHLLAGAYEHLAMRRRTRAEAIRLTAALKTAAAPLPASQERAEGAGR